MVRKNTSNTVHLFKTARMGPLDIVCWVFVVHRSLPSPYTSVSPSTENCEFGRSFVAPTSTLAKGSSALVVTMPEKPEDSNIRMAADGYANLAKDIHSAPACFIAWDVHLTKGCFVARNPLRNCGVIYMFYTKPFGGVERIYEVFSVQTPKLKLKLYQYSICRIYIICIQIL